MRQSPYFNEGKNKKIAFLFKEPGTYEQCLERPVAGLTGVHLDILLLKLREDSSLNHIFDSDNRYHYTITSALTKVGKTIPSKNIERLQKCLEGHKYCICFGAVAQEKFEKVFDVNAKKPKCINVCHISQQGLGAKYPKKGEHEGLNQIQRLELVAEEIVKKIKSYESKK